MRREIYASLLPGALRKELCNQLLDEFYYTDGASYHSPLRRIIVWGQFQGQQNDGV